MKIIHTADIHLGSKMDSRFRKDIAEKRKAELRDTFRRLVEYAERHDVSVIMICGDLFDSDRPFQKDKRIFYDIVRSSPKIDFLYLKGNHDLHDAVSEEIPENLKLFSQKWTSYSYGNVVISGLEIDSYNKNSFVSTLVLDKDKVNIVMLHGPISQGLNDGSINLKKLAGKNIDYLALGHIHKHGEGRIDERGEYVYCGCLEGRGFDEFGQHGFEILEIENGKISHQFMPFAHRTIHEIEVNISKSHNPIEVSRIVKEQVPFQNNDLYQINLSGEIDYDADNLADEVERSLLNSCYFVAVKDKTAPKIDFSKYDNQLSIRGEFIRVVQSKADLTQEEKQRIIKYGFQALDGKEIDL